MRIEIDEKVEETTLCECKFKCLQNELDGCCLIEKYDDNLNIYIGCSGSKYCNYKKALGNSSFKCTCPTRIKIYNKYGI